MVPTINFMPSYVVFVGFCDNDDLIATVKQYTIKLMIAKKLCYIVKGGLGNFGRGHLGRGHYGRGHLGRGHYGRGHLGRGHYGRGHLGRDHLGRGHFGPLI